MNMAVGIRLETDPSELHGIFCGIFSWDFPQLLELQLLKTPSESCFQSDLFRSRCFHNIRKVPGETNLVESF